MMAGCVMIVLVWGVSSLLVNLSAVRGHNGQSDISAAIDGIVSEQTEQVMAELLASAAEKQIVLKIGDDTEVIGKKLLSRWISIKTDSSDVVQYTADTSEITDYVHKLAEKYNTYRDYISFTTTAGETLELRNQGSGWILDEEYAVEQIKSMALSDGDSSVNLTDQSESGNKWWLRIMGGYRNMDDYGKSYAEVSIGQQCMWLYVDGELVIESPVITGNPTTGNDTPVGAFLVDEKMEDALLYGEDYEITVDYWVGFTYQIGFHDAQWQSEFGGEEYLENGSHGCVNLPLDTARVVYEKSFLDMPVFVY